MKLKLKNTPEQVELIKAMASREGSVAKEAQEAFAAFIGPVVNKVLLEAATSSAVYTDLAYDEDDSPSIPLDLFQGEGEGLVSVWSQSVAGGLPTSTVEGLSELKVSTYRLDSAVSFLKRYARRGRLDVASKAIERMTNEVLIKQERNAWAVVLKALADSGNTVEMGSNAESFTLSSLNTLVKNVKRLNKSYANGTTNSSYGLTDIFVSPETMSDIRAFAYNPVGGGYTNSSVPTAATVAPINDLPAGVREEIYRGGGTQEIYGISIHELVELGANQKYTKLFNEFFTGTPTAFTDSDDLIVGLDLTKDAFVRPIARNADSGSTFTAMPDDQFVARSEKIGFYGSLEEGRVCIDSRAVAGIAINR
jgi:hypothetical protein